MKAPNRTDIRNKIEDALNRVLTQVKVTSPSKKTIRAFEKACKQLSKALKNDLKKQAKRMAKTVTPAKKKVTKKKGGKKSTALS